MKIERITGAFDSPTDCKRVFLPFKYIHLICHCFSGKLSVIPMSVLDESPVATTHALLTYGNVLDFAPFGEKFVDQLCCGLQGILLPLRHWDAVNENSSALFVE